MNTPFNWPVRVYYEDTDAQGVVYYANYLRFYERARTEWLRSRGVDLHALAVDEDIVFVITESRVRYLRPARLNDELSVTADVTPLGRVQYRFEQKILAADGSVVSEAEMDAATVSASRLRPRRLPAWAASAIDLNTATG